MTRSPRERLRRILSERSVARGEFVLASGRRSSYYVDCRRTTFHPEGAHLVGQVMEPVVAQMTPAVDSIGGLTLGADPIAVAIGITSQIKGRPIRMFTVRKHPKSHGTARRIEGAFEPGDRVLVLEDTITSGRSALRAVEAIRAAEGDVAGVLALVDREEGGREALRAAGLEFSAVFSITELL